MKMKKLLFIAGAALVFAGCKNNNEEQQLAWQAKYDSLTNEINVRNESVVMMQKVNTYMDSIESYKNWLKIEIETGIDQNDIEVRMKNLNQFVKQTEQTIKNLEKSRAGYSSLVAQMKKDFEKKTLEIVNLQKQIASLEEANNQLVVLVSQKDDEIKNKSLTIEEKEAQITKVESQVEDLMKQALQLEAESYYSRAKALELAAQRTKLAPGKKKETLTQSYELYKKALDKGYDQASQDVTRLKNILEK